MSFWYDIKQKKYASNTNERWLRAYVEKVLAAFRLETDGKLSGHFNGASDRHTATNVDCADGSTVQQSLDKKVDKVNGKALSSNDYTNAEKAKLSGIESGAQVNTVRSVAGRTGNVTLSKADVGLDKVDNTADMDKPISNAVKEALASKVDVSAAIGRKTANGGELLNDYETNEAICKYATASGTENLAGIKGFKVLSKSGTEGKTGTYTLDSVAGLAVGDVYSVRFDWDFIDRGTITKISGKAVTVDNYVSNGLDASEGKDDEWENVLFVIAKPTIGTVSRGMGAYATGVNNKNYGTGSFVTGLKNIIYGLGSFVSGKSNKAGCCASAGGYGNTASGTFSMAFGAESEATRDCDIALGRKAKAKGQYSFAVNDNTTASGLGSSAFGTDTEASGQDSHTEGHTTFASALCAHAEGRKANASGNYSHAEGYNTNASGTVAHSEGQNTKATGPISHAEGNNTTASNEAAHAEGENTTANGKYSHAEGYGTNATGEASHAEGQNTKATHYAHAEGLLSKATGAGAHAEGQGTEAKDAYSHVEGIGTKSTGDASHVQGMYNHLDGKVYAHVVGWGTAGNPRNIHTLDTNGNAFYTGNLETTGIILKSVTQGSTKRFLVTIDDSGELKATEV